MRMVAERADGAGRLPRARVREVAFRTMAIGDSGNPDRSVDGRAPRGARATVVAYHETELARLIEHVREGLARYDAGDIDAFELDELIHHYKRASQKLWTFCTGGGAQTHATARTIGRLHEQGELPEWWEQATPRRTRG
jgi:hypothetical protein